MKSQTGAKNRLPEIALVAAATTVQLYISPPSGGGEAKPGTCPVHHNARPPPYRVHIQPPAAAGPAAASTVPLQRTAGGPAPTGSVPTNHVQNLPHYNHAVSPGVSPIASVLRVESGNVTQPGYYVQLAQPSGVQPSAWAQPSGVQAPRGQATWAQPSGAQFPGAQYHGAQYPGARPSAQFPSGLEGDVQRYLTALGGNQLASGYCAHQPPSWEMQDMVTRTLQSQGLYRFDPNQFSYGLWNEANRQYWWLRQQEEWYKQQQAMQELTDDDFSDDEDGAVLKGNKQSGKSSESYRVLESF